MSRPRSSFLTGSGWLILIIGIVVAVAAGYFGFKWLTSPKAAPAQATPAATETRTPAQADKAKAAPAKTEPKDSKAAGKTEQTDQGYTILIKKSEFKVYVKDASGKIVDSFGCALGKATGDKEEPGDNKTPDGTFKVTEINNASTWSHDFKDGKGVIEHAYGPWFFYLDTDEKSKGRWDGIGIHGTHAPDSIGTLASEGCIRVLNENCQKLHDKYIRIGTMVTIEE